MKFSVGFGLFICGAGVGFGLGGLVARLIFKDYVNPHLLDFDLLDCAMKEDERYEEMKECAEAAVNVRNELINSGKLSFEDARALEIETMRETIETVKHANARDALIAFRNTSPYIRGSKVSWSHGSVDEFSEIFNSDGSGPHKRSKVHEQLGVVSK